LDQPLFPEWEGPYLNRHVSSSRDSGKAFLNKSKALRQPNPIGISI